MTLKSTLLAAAVLSAGLFSAGIIATGTADRASAEPATFSVVGIGYSMSKDQAIRHATHAWIKAARHSSPHQRIGHRHVPMASLHCHDRPRWGESNDHGLRVIGDPAKRWECTISGSPLGSV